MRIGITGSRGFIGWHLRCLLFTEDGVEVEEATRETYANPAALRSFVRGADVIVHLAGVNRAADEEGLYDGNIHLARQLVDSCEAAEVAPRLIFASSTHVGREPLTTYGRAKRACTDLFEAWAGRSGAVFIPLIIPHVFGEYGRPFYNSAVATFCYQLARGESPTVDNDAPLELIHAQDLAEEVLAAARSGEAGQRRLHGHSTTVSEVVAQLQEMKRLYKTGVLPNLEDGFSTRLFNTLRSFCFPSLYPVEVSCFEDSRGQIFEAVRAQTGGQCFVSTTEPGITRGNHFHRYKFERFLVLAGRARIRVRKLFEDQVHEFLVDGDQRAYVDIPTLQTHDITNVGDDELVTLFWANEIFDPKLPDTYAHPV